MVAIETRIIRVVVTITEGAITITTTPTIRGDRLIILPGVCLLVFGNSDFSLLSTYCTPTLDAYAGLNQSEGNIRVLSQYRLQKLSCSRSFC